ncbi:casein kinase I isoform alpha [Streptomyces lydicamycinicus]|uniref:Casein kinase I isoform alpha n=1 Tax=Streptomyces lydicamycinicus TaxID=1546107 RepID=A0A0P4RDR2_9ACTN|nr:hypothetical protein [Streptomyces lydicamycinicus]GAO11368.1 casein kinase I isoform alpha [Streptomyces lydicamycinicus]
MVVDRRGSTVWDVQTTSGQRLAVKIGYPTYAGWAHGDVQPIHFIIGPDGTALRTWTSIPAPSARAPAR